MVRSKQVRVQPAQTQLCVKCMETGTSRSCCGNTVCEQCYVNPNNICPACSRSYQLTDYTVEGGYFSEKEECRRCLEHGKRRRCCGEYYCDACFREYSHILLVSSRVALFHCCCCAVNRPTLDLSAHCPSCQKAISTRGLSKAQALRNTPGSVLLGYCLSYTVIATMLAGFAIVLSNELLSPKTLFGFTCRGFYPTCSLDRCVDMDDDEGTATVESLKHWKPCSVTTENKFRGASCAFDPELYGFTDGEQGADFCTDDIMQGIFIFEDLFEDAVDLSDPMSTTMRSAKWDSIVNGRVTTDCTVGAGKYSLAFAGATVREAVTTDLDVQHGGSLQFLLRIAPLREDSLTSQCATSFQGIVFVQYSIDQGNSWTTLMQFDAATFRSSSFRSVVLKLPSEARTNATRFRWSQKHFEDRRDHWAIDNVRVERSLTKNWRRNKVWRDTQIDGLNWMQKIQCCFDTDLCDTWRKKRDYSICSTIRAWRDHPVAREKGTTGLKGAELYIVIAIAILGIRVLYVTACRFLMGDSNFLARVVVRLVRANILPSVFEIQQAHYDQVHSDPSAEQKDNESNVGTIANSSKLRKTFKPKSSLAWQWGFTAFAVCSLCLVFVVTSWAFTDRLIVQRFVLYGGSETTSEVHSSFIFVCAIVLDAVVVWSVLVNVICAYKRWQPRITIDVTDEVNAMFVDGYIIPLSQITESQMFGRRFVLMCAGGYAWTTLPWAMLGLLLSDCGLEYEAVRVVSVAIGLFTCFRALLGVNVMIEFGFMLEYIFGFSIYIRDAVGAALTERRTALAAINAAVACVAIGSCVCVTIALELLLPLVGVFLVFGFLYGMITGCVHALPISPWIVLTCLPENGVWLRVQRKERCPCVYWGGYCTEMHRRNQVLIIPLANQIECMDMLVGRIGS